MKLQSNLHVTIAAGLLCSAILLPQWVNAKGSATDTSTAPSNKPVAGGGGGKSSSSKTTTTTPTPAPALSSGPITYAAAGLVNGVLPVCTGDYRIQAYYPALLDMTVNTSVSSLNVPDGTVLYVNVVGTGYMYSYTSNAMVVLGGVATCSEKLFVGLGVGVAGVTVTDGLGTIIFAGN